MVLTRQSSARRRTCSRNLRRRLRHPKAVEIPIPPRATLPFVQARIGQAQARPMGTRASHCTIERCWTVAASRRGVSGADLMSSADIMSYAHPAQILLVIRASRRMGAGHGTGAAHRAGAVREIAAALGTAARDRLVRHEPPWTPQAAEGDDWASVERLQMVFV